MTYSRRHKQFVPFAFFFVSVGPFVDCVRTPAQGERLSQHVS